MNKRLDALFQNLTTNLLASEAAAELVVIGLLADGHVLIQGAPGTGKTSLARTVALSIQSPFRRIQFTPDLLPTEILGYNIYDQSSGEFVFHSGPVFSNVLLADEINRASPRTQSALLEAMNEKQVTIDGVTYALGSPFFVIATENHLSSAGTFPLPDSQLDRFLVSFNMPVPDSRTQVDILMLHAGEAAQETVSFAMTGEELVDLQKAVRLVRTAQNVLEYIVHLCGAIGEHADFVAAPSTRASIALMNAAKARAFIKERDAVYPDDVKRVLPYVFRHRMALKATTGRSDSRVENILRDIIESTPVPFGE